MGLSNRQDAAPRGVSHTAVAKALATGRISAEPDGSLRPSECRPSMGRGDRSRQTARRASVAGASGLFGPVRRWRSRSERTSDGPWNLALISQTSGVPMTRSLTVWPGVCGSGLLCIIDDFRRECLGALVDTSISGHRVTRELDQIARVRGYPCMVVSERHIEAPSV